MSVAAEALREGSFTIWSPGYAPPEVLCRQPILIPEAVDVFAFGVIITAIVGGPQSQSTHKSGAEKSSRHASTGAPTFLRTLMQAYAIATYKPVLQLSCPPPLAAVVRACCSPSPEDRPCFVMLRGMLDEAATRVASWPQRRPT